MADRVVVHCKVCGVEIVRPLGARGPAPTRCASTACNTQHEGRITLIQHTVFASSMGSAKWDNKPKFTFDKKQTEDWYCQVCGSINPKEISPSVMPMETDMSEFVKCCSGCYNKSVKKHIKEVHQLINYIRQW